MKEKNKVDTTKNLIPFNQLTEEQQREIAKKGAMKSVKVRKEKKLMKEALKELLKLPIKNSDIKAELEELGLEKSEMNNQTALIVSAYKSGLEGNIKAIEFIRDTIGEKPKEEIKVNTNNETFDSILTQLGGKGLNE